MGTRRSRTIEQQIQVRYSYPVRFTREMFDPANATLADVCTHDDDGRQRKALAVLDAGVATAYPSLADAIGRYVSVHADALRLTRPPMLVDGGEQIKNDHATLEAIQQEIDRGGIDRHSFVIAIGGGAVLDMVGFAAATAHRGIRLIRVPTTILSQNDSGVGVKNSVNAFGKKNFLGTFAPPYAVINDAALVERLPDREWRAGIAEAIKVALLKDPAFFAFIEANAAALLARDAGAMDHLIYRCAELHLQHIATSGDPFEFGSSRPLDFGHWSAHKLEQISNYAWRHGEAVAVGICLDATYSWQQGLLAEAEWRRIIDVFHAVGLPAYAPELIDSLQHAGTSRSVLSGLEEFREHLGGQLTIMLIRGIGKPYEVHTMDEPAIINSMQVLKAEHEAWSKKESSYGEHVRAQQSSLAATAD
jgi:3-dehydroquinate synthase